MPQFSAKLRRRQLDELLKGHGLPRLPRGYIREIRDALGMSSQQLAERMGVSKATVQQLEESEQAGTITLRSLQRAAAAMDCELVYGFVPRESLETIVRKRAHVKAKELASGVQRTMALEQQATDAGYTDDMLSEIAEEFIRKGGRELWK
jgi:predicted DNA-binding mobile mystery protein A